MPVSQIAQQEVLEQHPLLSYRYSDLLLAGDLPNAIVGAYLIRLAGRRGLLNYVSSFP